MRKFINPFLPKGAVGPLTSSPVVKRYAGNPLLIAAEVPFPCNLAFNAGVAKFRGRYYMAFRYDTFRDNDRNKGLIVSGSGLAESDDGLHWKAHEKPIAQAFQQYTMENNDWLCPVNSPGGTPFWTKKIYHILLSAYDLDVVKDYTGKLLISVCPSEKDPIGPSGSGQFDYGHYLANANAVGYYNNTDNVWKLPCNKISRLKKASSVVLIGDNNRKNSHFVSAGNDYDNSSYGSTSKLNDVGGCSFRHGKNSANFGYADGHSENLSLSTIYHLTKVDSSKQPARKFLNNGVNVIYF